MAGRDDLDFSRKYSMPEFDSHAGEAYQSVHQRGKKICIGPSRMMWTSGWSLADQTWWNYWFDVYRELAIHTIFKILSARLPYITPFYGTDHQSSSRIFVYTQRKNNFVPISIYIYSSIPLENHDSANLSNSAPRPPPHRRLDFSSTAQVKEADPPVQGSSFLFFLFFLLFFSFGAKELFFFSLLSFRTRLGAWNYPTTPHWSGRISSTISPVKIEFTDTTPTWRTIVKFSTFACHRSGVRPGGASSAPRRRYSIKWVIKFPFLFFYLSHSRDDKSIEEFWSWEKKNVRRRSFARKRKTQYRARSLRNSTTWTRRLARRWRKRKTTRRSGLRRNRTRNRFRADLQRPGRRGSRRKYHGISDLLRSLKNAAVCICMYVCSCAWKRLNLWRTFERKKEKRKKTRLITLARRKAKNKLVFKYWYLNVE